MNMRELDTIRYYILNKNYNVLLIYLSHTRAIL